MSIVTKNQEADNEIATAIEAFQEAASGGLDVMSLAMNPKGAMTKFAGPVTSLVQGLQRKNEVVTDLMYQIKSLSEEMEALRRG